MAFPDTQGRRDESAGNVLAQFLIRDVADIQWMAVDSLSAQKRLIEAGFGIALLPDSSISEERKAKSLATIAVGDLKAANSVTAITRKNGYFSAAAQKLLDILMRDYR